VLRDGPAEAAGLRVGDELLALDQQRLRTPEEVSELLAEVKQGQALPLLYCRDGRVRSTELVPGPAEVEQWQLQIDPQAPPAASAARGRWRSLLP
jgi:predicted metalloprotease with PDZ domain